MNISKFNVAVAVVLIGTLHFLEAGGHVRCTDSEVSDNGVNLSENLPPCVSSIENLWTGRSRSGIAGGGSALEIPTWFNATLATIGQRFAAKHWFSTNFGMIIAELLVVAQHDRAYAIYYMGGVDTWSAAVKRFSANILQDSVWYKEDLFGPMTNLLESLNKVRSIHLTVNHRLETKPKVLPPNPYKIDEKVWRAFEKDLKVSAIKIRTVPEIGMEPTPYDINQLGMGTTLWGLAGMPIIRPELFGFPPNAGTDEELEGFLHFWAFIGHCVGVEPEFNVCLQPNVHAARDYFERVLYEHLVPYWFSLSYEAKVLVENSMKGFTNSIGPIAQFDMVLRRMLDVIGVPSRNLAAAMSPIGRTMNGIWQTALLPALRNLKSMRSLTDIVYNGYIQNLSLRVFGFNGTNKTIVADQAFSFWK